MVYLRQVISNQTWLKRFTWPWVDSAVAYLMGAGPPSREWGASGGRAHTQRLDAEPVNFGCSRPSGASKKCVVEESGLERFLRNKQHVFLVGDHDDIHIGLSQVHFPQ